jgi:D-xylonolactonase
MSSDCAIQEAAPQIECIADYACETGENPLWHPLEKRLYWCDIPRGRIFRYDPASGTHEQCHAGRPVGGFTIQADGSLLLFMDRGTIADWREGKLTEVLPEIEGERSSRFNDVIADPVGRVFCGTMSCDAGNGSLYRLDLDGSLHRVLTDVGCSNGMAFTLDRKGLYYTDSFACEVYLFDYDEGDGSLSNRRVFATFAESEGLPDGATLDAQGCLWSALWGGASIVRIGPDGQIEERIPIPAKKASSLTFGGEDYTEMYITTAGGNTNEEDGAQAGALFRLKAYAQGVPEFFSRIPVPLNRAADSTA